MTVRLSALAALLLGLAACGLPEVGALPGDGAGGPRVTLPDAGPGEDPPDGGGEDRDGGALPDGGQPLPDAGIPTELVHYVGRFDFQNPLKPRFEWSGSAMIASFTGTGVSVKLAGSANQFALVIDGAKATVVKYSGTPGTLVLAAGLPEGTHRVELHKRTEASFGPTEFDGFIPAGGALVPTPAPYQRHLEFIGDSITCGYGNEGVGPSCHFSADTENEYLAYGALTARALAASHTVIAWSGKGVVRNYGGDNEPHMPDYFERTLPTLASSVWDFAAQSTPPDAVIIDLGTNDYSTADPGPTFEPTYETLLARVRSVYPDAFILCSLGPLLNTAEAIGKIKQAVAARKAAGDSNIDFLEFPPQNSTEVGLGCDYHPSLLEDQVMANALTQALKTRLHW